MVIEYFLRLRRLQETPQCCALFMIGLRSDSMNNLNAKVFFRPFLCTFNLFMEIFFVKFSGVFVVI